MISEGALLEVLCEKMHGIKTGQIKFSMNLFNSLEDYCHILSQDMTRSGIVKRQILCEALEGPVLKEHRQLTKVHEVFGHSRRLISQGVAQRLKYVDGYILTPLL